jgi:prevent-host-death family protein
MTTINIHEAKTHLSRYVELAASGNEVIIAKSGKPVTKLVPLDDVPARRKLGIFQGRLKVPDNFDAPLPNEVIESFENGGLFPLNGER